MEGYRGLGDARLHFLGPLAGRVLGVSPPLVITEKELAEAFSTIETAWARIA